VFAGRRKIINALAVLREVCQRVDSHRHLYSYGPHITQPDHREALAALISHRHQVAPVCKDGSWIPRSTEELTEARHDNLPILGWMCWRSVNLRLMLSPLQPTEGSLEAPLGVLTDLQRQADTAHGEQRHTTQVAEDADLRERLVQNHYT